MKKSVLLPYERYEHLLSQARNTNNSTLEVDTSKSVLNKPNCGIHANNSLDSNVILSCFPISERNQVEKLLTLFNTAPRSLSYDRDGNVLLDGVTVHGCHISDLLNRMRPSGGTDSTTTTPEDTVLQTGDGDAKSAKSAKAKSPTTALASATTKPTAVPSSSVNTQDNSWINAWRPLRK